VSAAGDGQLSPGAGAARRAVRPRPAATSRGARPAPEPAARLPVARVAVDVGLAHLDRPFDYLVPAGLDAEVVPGSRVRVRFAGQTVAGVVLDRVPASDHEGRLAFLTRAVSPEPVLRPEVARLARAVADRWAGTLSDVLRLALPPRHARVESEPRGEPAAAPLAPGPGSWERYDAGPQYLAALAAGGSPRAVWTALPGPDWPEELARAVAAALAGGRGAVVVVPDARDVERVHGALRGLLGADRHVVLRADLGPAERYRRFLAVSRGRVRAVVGTRAAAFAPVADLGLVAIWDDGDDLHAEPHAPYPHTRDLLLLRASLAGAAALVGGPVRTAEGQLLVESGWAAPLAASRAAVRGAAPRVVAAGSEIELARDPAARSARLPGLALTTAREALEAGRPVLVQVPRRGYVPALACRRCRAPARCDACAGPLGVPAGGPDAVPACRWCGRPAAAWACAACASRALRAVVTGAGRTAEELGRAFPGVAVRTSGRDDVLARVGGGPALVVATPGAEPVADGGYGAALLLDGWALLTRPDLRAAEEALRRWSAAVALVRPATAGGRVVVMADAGLPAVQALVRGDAEGAAGRELAERRELGFPPATRLAAVQGSAAAVAEVLAELRLPPGGEVLGPVPVWTGRPPSRGVEPQEQERALVRVPRAAGADLAAAMRAVQAHRSARKAEAVRVRLDPGELL
jgi:primosomal protein N' (replication factor Y) (superfamily II helicase)